MKILILGGAGFLGTNLTRGWLGNPDAQVTVLDSFDNRFQSNKKSLDDVWEKISVVRGSILDERLLAEIVPQHDVIYHLAAQSSHTLSLKQPILDAEINCLGTLKLLESIRLFHPEALVIYPSSTTSVGKAEEDIIDENHSEKPLEIYSANKGVSEKYFQIYNLVHGLKTIVFRFSNLYGPYGKASAEFGFINHFIYQALNHRPLTIFGSGEQIRNVLYVGDAVELLMSAAYQPQLCGQLAQATSPHHHSVRQIAQTIVETFQSGHVVYETWPNERKRIDVESVRFSSEKLRALTGWSAPTDLVTGIRRTCEILLSSESRERP
ncbi:MAG: NAD-dependent epimerase/dehydratase family protein [Candidatus Omnitrophica bacterium]|nr:NAD-dependent epimerase/dehydratase family protein [Candidatus Omnitrophota bacterium]